MEPSFSQRTTAGSGERYVLSGASRFMLTRTAERQARFFLPQLRPQLSLLDCGCGPGSITSGLARLVAPGEVVGVDINADDITYARSSAHDQGIGNLRFETADAYALPFPDHAFDAVFSHALLEHLRDPLAALKEMHRVLKPGGVIGVRAPDFDGNVIAPDEPLVMRVEALYEQLSRHGGGNPRVGKHLRALLREATFAEIVCSASYDWFDAPEATLSWGTGAATLLALRTEQLIELGWADRDEIEAMSQAYQAWGANRDAFMARAFVEAVGHAA